MYQNLYYNNLYNNQSSSFTPYFYYDRYNSNILNNYNPYYNYYNNYNKPNIGGFINDLLLQNSNEIASFGQYIPGPYGWLSRLWLNKWLIIFGLCFIITSIILLTNLDNITKILICSILLLLFGYLFYYFYTN